MSSKRLYVEDLQVGQRFVSPQTQISAEELGRTVNQQGETVQTNKTELLVSRRPGG